jgi:TonB family protein
MSKGKLAAVMSAALLVAGSAGAQEADRPADWVKRPTANDLLSVWPQEALRRGVGGRAIIACTVSLQGALYDCVIDSETPPDVGFGRAALALTPQFQVKPAIRNGQPVLTRVRIPIDFPKPDKATGTHLPGDRDIDLRSLNLSNVDWSAAPTYDQVVAAYPEKARAAGAGGRVTLSCNFKGAGALGGCTVLSEEPTGLGLAQAARRLTPYFRGPETLPNGRRTVGVSTQLVFVFSPDMLDPERRVIGKPQWAALPSGEAVAANYPRAAASVGVRQGRAVLGCIVGDGGRLTNCAVQGEQPADLGFGPAALDLAQSFRLRTWTSEGLPTIGGSVNVPIRYEQPTEEPADGAP